MATPGYGAEREELNRRHQKLGARLEAEPPEVSDASLVEELRVITWELQELDLDDLLRSSMEGGSEG